MKSLKTLKIIPSDCLHVPTLSESFSKQKIDKNILKLYDLWWNDLKRHGNAYGHSCDH